MVVGTLMAVGQEIMLACAENPTKVLGSDKIIPRWVAKGGPSHNKTITGGS